MCDRVVMGVLPGLMSNLVLMLISSYLTSVNFTCPVTGRCLFLVGVFQYMPSAHRPCSLRWARCRPRTCGGRRCRCWRFLGVLGQRASDGEAIGRHHGVDAAVAARCRRPRHQQMRVVRGVVASLKLAAPHRQRPVRSRWSFFPWHGDDHPSASGLQSAQPGRPRRADVLGHTMHKPSVEERHLPGGEFVHADDDLDVARSAMSLRMGLRPTTP